MIGALLGFTLALQMPPGAWVGVYAQTLDGTVLVERNADRLFVPASNQKLLTAAYAWARLGPDWRPRTAFWRSRGRLIVEAQTGDPSLTSAQLRKIRRSLGFSSGMVAIRQPYRVEVPPSWEHDDLPNRYAPAITGLTVDRGGFEVWAERGRLVPLPPPLEVQVRRSTSVDTVEFDRFRRELRVGTPLPSKRTRLDTFALPAPDRTAARWLGAKRIEIGATVPTRKPDRLHLGPPLRKLVADCLGPSDNHLAEHLLLMTALAEGPLGRDPYKTARERLMFFLNDDVGLSDASVKPEDGSGLARQNFITPRALTHLLLFLRRRPDFELFAAGLARPGVGTLRNRLAGSSFRGKTGTLNHTVTLSGYVMTPSGEAVVTLMVNHAVRPTSEIAAQLDRVILAVERGEPIGPDLAIGSPRGSQAVPDPSPGGPPRDRYARSFGDGSASCPWTDRRAQSADAVFHRTIGVAVRPR